MLGIYNHTGITSCTTGRVDTYSIVQIAANQSVGIVVAQILLRGERNLTQVIEAVDRVSRNTQIA